MDSNRDRAILESFGRQITAHLSTSLSTMPTEPYPDLVGAAESLAPVTAVPFWDPNEVRPMAPAPASAAAEVPTPAPLSKPPLPLPLPKISRRHPVAASPVSTPAPLAIPPTGIRRAKPSAPDPDADLVPAPTREELAELQEAMQRYVGMLGELRASTRDIALGATAHMKVTQSVLTNAERVESYIPTLGCLFGIITGSSVIFGFGVGFLTISLLALHARGLI